MSKELVKAMPEEGAHGKSPKCLDGNLGDFGEFCKGLIWS